jgi:putative FmdB family regulatory protein
MMMAAASDFAASDLATQFKSGEFLSCRLRLNSNQVMPLHEYQCRKCGHRFERIHKFSDPPLKKCPECGGKVDQLISSPAVHFKGSGFYATDYGRKGSGGASKDGDSSAGDESSAGKAREKTDSSPSSEAAKGATQGATQGAAKGTSQETGQRGDSERSRSQDSQRTKSRDREESRSKSPSGDKKSSKR